MEMTHEELADILYTVSNRLSRLPWDTGVEKALREVADEIASRAEPKHVTIDSKNTISHENARVRD